MGLKWHKGEEMTEFGVNYIFKCICSLSALHLGYLENAFLMTFPPFQTNLVV